MPAGRAGSYNGGDVASANPSIPVRAPGLGHGLRARQPTDARQLVVVGRPLQRRQRHARPDLLQPRTARHRRSQAHLCRLPGHRPVPRGSVATRRTMGRLGRTAVPRRQDPPPQAPPGAAPQAPPRRGRRPRRSCSGAAARGCRVIALLSATSSAHYTRQAPTVHRSDDARSGRQHNPFGPATPKTIAATGPSTRQTTPPTGSTTSVPCSRADVLAPVCRLLGEGRLSRHRPRRW